MIAAAEGRFDDSLADLAAAFELSGRIGQPFERARTLLALGTAQRRAKQRGAARASLEAALALFAELGAELWAARAQQEIARLGGRRARHSDEPHADGAAQSPGWQQTAAPTARSRPSCS
jgi:hypothetical protein